MQICNVGHKRIFAMLCIAVLLWANLPAYGYGASEAAPDGYKLAGSEGNLKLYYSPEKASIIVRNTDTGYTWSSALDEDSIPKELTKAQVKEVSSLLDVTYTSISDFSSKSRNKSLEGLGYELKTKEIDNGIEYEIYMPDLDCQINVRCVLDEYGLKVTIPQDGISEALKSGEQITSACKEIKDEIGVQRAAFEKIREGRRTSAEDKKKVDISLEYLDRMEEIVDGIDSAYGIASKAGELSSMIDDMNKKGYRSTGIIKLKKQVAQMEATEAAAIVSINLMPYFGACDDSTDGYALYPDGSGAITYFKDSHGEFKSSYNAYTYSRMNTDIDAEIHQENDGLVNQTVPYFGIKSGDDAFIAYVTGGQAMYNISFRPSGYVMPISRASSGFTYRTTVATSSVNGEWQSGSDVMVFESDPARYDASVEFQFLSKDAADYSGMANALRNYLAKEGILSKSQLVNGELPLAVDFLGTYNEKLLVFDRYKVATEFSQASEVVKLLGDVPLLCNHKGAFSKGYNVYPEGSKISRSLGSGSELHELAEQVRGTGGQLYLENNQFLADLEESDYKESELTIGNQYVVLRNSADNTRFIFSPKTVSKRNEDLLESCADAGNVAIADAMMGSFIYQDYSKRSRTTRLDTVEIWRNMLSAQKETLGSVSVKLGNDYTWNTADWIAGVPCGISGYSYTDEEVPFYELLTHGYIAETSGYINEYHDREEQLLQAIEYGLIPYYSLSVNSVDWNVEGCYSSKFSDVYEDIVRTYNRCNEALGDVMDVPIVSHERDGDIVTVTYENGTKILINYSDQVQKSGDVTIQPMDFAKITNEEDTTDVKERLETRTIESEAQGTAERVSVYSSLAVWISIVLFVSIAVLCGISIFKHKGHKEL